MMLSALLPYLSGKDGTEPVPPEPHGFMANIDATLEQNIFYLPKRRWIADYIITTRRITSGELLK